MKYLNSFGDEIKFDKNGDPAAMYDLINWQVRQSGAIEFVTVGTFDETTVTGKQKLHIQQQMIVWNGNKTQVRIPINKTTICGLHSVQSNCIVYVSRPVQCSLCCLGAIVSMQQYLSSRNPQGNPT